MDLYLHEVSLEKPLLDHLARWLLDHAPRAAQGDLSGTLVLLPAVRACASLRHRLLEISGKPALLLPEVTTPAHLAQELARRFAPTRPTLPAATLRAALLTPHLVSLTWVQAHPESAPGLAEEFIDLFDQVRRYDRSDILDGAGVTLDALGASATDYRAGDRERTRAGDDLSRPGSGLDQQLDHQDLQRIREVWRVYRQVIPRDEVDQLLEVTRTLQERDWPGQAPDLVLLAGFAHLDPVTARLVREIGQRSETHLFEAAAGDPLSRLFLATYPDFGNATGDAESEGLRDDATHPLQPARSVRNLLLAPAGTAPETTSGDATATSTQPSLFPPRGDGQGGAEPATFRERLAAEERGWRELAADHRIELISCDDPEQESRTVAARVVQAITRWRQDPTSAAGSQPRIAVATADRDLTRRVAAQLRDAGLDCDDTGGVSLGELPAGLLAQHILQTLVTGFHHEPLLELLTHPFVDLVTGAAARPGKDSARARAGTTPRRGHALRTLRFEKMVRAGQRPLTGLEGYRRLAEEWDGKARRLDQPWQGDMSTFVQALTRALSSLEQLATGKHPWSAHLIGFRCAWQALAPGRPLDPACKRQDEAALARLLDDLENALAELPRAARSRLTTSLGDFAAMLMRLLAARTVWPHRRPFLPVVVTGLLEARLESYDLLVLAGMSEEVFPGRQARPLFLGESARRRLGLPDWRSGLGQQAELFLRLLHNGERIVLTWPADRASQPCLASPFIIRICLSGHLIPVAAVPQPLYRRAAAPREVIAAAQRGFMAEPVAVPVAAVLPPLVQLSHTSLKTFRDCPYRFLLERGFGMREEEEVLEAFRRLDFGNLVHACLCDFLQPGGPGHDALVAGERELALASLGDITGRTFAEGAEAMPQRHLWEESFRILIPQIVDYELGRFAAGWRPLSLEEDFTLSLGQLDSWLKATTAAMDSGAATVILPRLEPEAGGWELRGKIDRIDRLDPVEGEGIARPTASDLCRLAVIDYKTGITPTGAEVRDGRDLQILLYSLAVETGGMRILPGSLARRVVQGAYYQISAQLCGFNPQRPHLKADGPDGRATLVNGAILILAAAQAAGNRAGPFPLIPEYWQDRDPGSLPCRHCPYQAVCRLEERALPPGLQRAVASERARVVMG